MRLIRHTNTNVNPADDARIFNKVLPNGLFEDVEITSLGSNKVSIGPTYGIVQGRDFQTESMILNTILSTDGNKKGFIILKINIADDNPIEIDSRLEPYTPIQEDINDTGKVYEYILATYTCSPISINTINKAYSIVGGNKSISHLVNLNASSWIGDNAPYLLTVNNINPIQSQKTLIDMTYVNQGNTTNEEYKIYTDKLEAAAIKPVNEMQSACSITLKAWGEKPNIDLPILLIIGGEVNAN